MSWPFQRANALGFAMFENFTSAQATIIDGNAASAADGSIWSDIALAGNLLPKEIIDTDSAFLFGQAVVWEPVSRRWFSVGKTTAGRSIDKYSYSQGIWQLGTLESDTSAVTTWLEARCAATDGNENTVVGGYASSASKIRWFNGTTWAAINTIATGTNAVDALVWAPSASLFIAGLGINTTTNVETSLLGSSWTQRTTPNSHLRKAAAASASRVVVIPNATVDKFITSEDGITWTERTVSMPPSAWQSITWNAERGLFMAIAGVHVVTSPDGITWTTRSTTAPDDSAVASIIRSIGRMWLRANDSGFLRVSVDDGVNWKILAQITLGSSLSFGVAPKQVLLASDDTVVRSFAGGL